MMQTEKGTLEAVMYAYATTYYTWIRRGGVLVVNQYVANTEARFVYGCSSHQGSADGKCGKYAYALQATARSVNVYADLKVDAM